MFFLFLVFLEHLDGGWGRLIVGGVCFYWSWVVQIGDKGVVRISITFSFQ